MTAPVRQRRTRAREPRRDQRPQLRVVPPNTLSAAGRRRRARRLVVFGFLVVAGALFAVVSFHVLIMQGQFRLERLEDRAAEEQARFEQLRLRVAELEAPGRIVATAQDELGMVPPATVVYLSSTRPRTQSDAAQPERADDGSWASVKRHLAAQP